MPRHVAFLRGVSPQNCRMPELRRCFEAAGFTDVKTVLSSGNVVFGARAGTAAAIERKAEAAMLAGLGRRFATIVRRIEALQALLDADPFADARLPPDAKRVVTFLRDDAPAVALPIERDGVRILRRIGAEVFTAYVPNDKGPVFMTLLERAFGSGITTRTLDTVRKCAALRIP